MNIQSPYIDLSCAFINELIKEYKGTYRTFKDPDSRPAKNAIKERQEIEEYVRSDEIEVFCGLSGVDKYWIIQKIDDIKNGVDKTSARYSRLRNKIAQ